MHWNCKLLGFIFQEKTLEICNSNFQCNNVISRIFREINLKVRSKTHFHEYFVKSTSKNGASTHIRIFREINAKSFSRNFFAENFKTFYFVLQRHKKNHRVKVLVWCSAEGRAPTYYRYTSLQICLLKCNKKSCNSSWG